jgi:hypothetical protein
MIKDEKLILDVEDCIRYAMRFGYVREYESKPYKEIILIKDWLRTKHKIILSNEHGERGSMNRKTVEYFTCEISKRMPNPHKPGQKYNYMSSYQTYDCYENAVIHGITFAIDHLIEKGSLQKYLDDIYRPVQA